MSVLTINSAYDTLFPEEGINHSSCAKHWSLACQDIACADTIEGTIKQSHPSVDLIAYWFVNDTTEVYPIGWCHARSELIIFESRFVLNPPRHLHEPSALVEVEQYAWTLRSITKLIALTQKVKDEIIEWGETAFIDSFLAEFGNEVVAMMD